MKRIISILALLIIIPFWSCTDDDNVFSIDGVWKGVTKKHVEIQNGVVMHDDLEDISSITEFINALKNEIKATFKEDISN